MNGESFPPLAAAARDLVIVERELDLLLERLSDAASLARGVADATRWQSEAATAFREKARTWAGEVSGLICLAETARLAAAQARDRTALLATAPYPALFSSAAVQ